MTVCSFYDDLPTELPSVTMASVEGRIMPVEAEIDTHCMTAALQSPN
jgi:hypothetical protein